MTVMTGIVKGAVMKSLSEDGMMGTPAPCSPCPILQHLHADRRYSISRPGNVSALNLNTYSLATSLLCHWCAND